MQENFAALPPGFSSLSAATISMRCLVAFPPGECIEGVDYPDLEDLLDCGDLEKTQISLLRETPSILRVEQFVIKLRLKTGDQFR